MLRASLLGPFVSYEKQKSVLNEALFIDLSPRHKITQRLLIGTARLPCFG
jgi:hypothetical protein